MFKLSISALFLAILVSANPSFSDPSKDCVEEAEAKYDRCIEEARENASNSDYQNKMHYVQMLNGGCKGFYDSDVQKCRKTYK